MKTFTNKVRKNMLDYKSRKLRQYRTQGLSRAGIMEKVSKNKYLQFCLSHK